MKTSLPRWTRRRNDWGPLAPHSRGRRSARPSPESRAGSWNASTARAMGEGPSERENSVSGSESRTGVSDEARGGAVVQVFQAGQAPAGRHSEPRFRFGISRRSDGRSGDLDDS